MEFRSLALWTLYLTIAMTHIGLTVTASFPSRSLLIRTGNHRDGRIINGTEALMSNTKYQVSIRNRTANAAEFGSGHRCGASLISDNVVLSSAFCFIDWDFNNGTFMEADFFVAVMGNVDRFEKDNNTLIFNIKKVIKYDDVFNLQTMQRDLVLIMLDGAVPANHPTVKPINLNEDLIEGDTVCRLTGWGATDLIPEGNYDEDNFSTKLLMTVDLPIISYDICRNITDIGQHLQEGMICAGYVEGGRGACGRDIGGPLVCGDIQVGILSWAQSCAKTAVFTDVAFYKDWILSMVAANNGTLPNFGKGSTGVNNGTTGGGDGNGGGGGDGSTSSYNNSIILAILMIVFNVIFNKF